jgi:hypothetical protein
MSLKNIAIAFDQLLNTLLGSQPDETLSARCYRLRLVSPWWHAAQVVIDAIFFWQDQHCKQSYFSEYERNQLPGEYRK